MKKQMNKKGVSLIVLVITIIVMIILAGTIILSITNNGIIDKANEAVEKSDLKQIEQIATLGWSEAFLKETTATKNDAYYQTEVINYLKASGVTQEQLNKYTIKATASGITVKAVSQVDPEEISGIQFGKLYLSEEIGVGGDTLQQGFVLYEDEVVEVYIKYARMYGDVMVCAEAIDGKGLITYEENKLIMDNGDGTTDEVIVDPATGCFTYNEHVFSPTAQEMHSVYRSNDSVENVYTATDDDREISIKFGTDNMATIVNGGETTTVAMVVHEKGHIIIWQENGTEVVARVSYDGRAVSVAGIVLTLENPVELP